MDVIIHLEEKDRQRISYSFGSDGLGGLEGTFFYSIFNLLGLGEELGLEVGLGSQTYEFAVSMASRYLIWNHSSDVGPSGFLKGTLVWISQMLIRQSVGC